MLFILSLVQSIVLLVLAGIHFNWVLGGVWGFENALPTNMEGKKIMNPTRIESAVVGIGLFLFAIYYVAGINLLDLGVPNWLQNYAGWVISAIFVIRAIGDFNYVGFFKRITQTQFAKLDTLYYSPLCLVLGINGLLLELL